MIVLGVESSAVVASAAVLKDGKVIGEKFLNSGLTHSVTLLPMIKEVLDDCDVSVCDVDVFAVSAGPGSFTGLRIGAATVKGLCQNDARCIGVSTLLSMAYDRLDFDGVVCACMDARCSQVYNALFEIKDETPHRLCDDRALMIDELVDELKKIKQNILLVGDGALLCYNSIKETCPELLKRVFVKESDERFQRASGVCLASFNAMLGGEKPLLPKELKLN